MIKITLAGAAVLYCLSASLMAQVTAPATSGLKVYQLSGIVLNARTGEPVPFARVRSHNNLRRATANQDGFYSLPVTMTDTLYYYSVGFYRSQLPVGDYVTKYIEQTDSPYIYEIHYLREDSIVLPTLTIFPYKNAAELRTAMLNMPLPNYDPAAVAQDNVNPEVVAALSKGLEADAEERLAASRQRYYLSYQQQNQVSTVPLFDPIAVYKLVQYISSKTKQKREKSLDYWPD